MAHVDMERIVEHLSSEIRRALEDAVNETVDDADVDAHELFRAFRRAVRRKCSTWERVPDGCVKLD